VQIFAGPILLDLLHRQGTIWNAITLRLQMREGAFSPVSPLCAEYRPFAFSGITQALYIRPNIAQIQQQRCVGLDINGLPSVKSYTFQCQRWYKYTIVKQRIMLPLSQ
jgi:hypothetical protein